MTEPARRFELPSGLSADDESALLAALEQYFAEEERSRSAWAIAGFADSMAMGALQTRHRLPGAWQRAFRDGFARRGTPPLMGRGDSK